MLSNGDKLVVIKKVTSFLDEGDIAKVLNVGENTISFAFGEGFPHMGIMSSEEFEKHFKKVEEKVEVPSITLEYVESIMEESTISVQTVFDKCTIVSCQLPNGFVIVESSACVSPENYDEETGTSICLEKIRDKIWELEAYKLQDELYETVECNCNCDECYCDECPCVDRYDEDDKCLDTDIDCDECEDYDCPFNPYI